MAGTKINIQLVKCADFLVYHEVVITGMFQ